MSPTSCPSRELSPSDPPDSQDDAALCARLRVGSDEAARELFQRHFRPLYRYVLTRVGGRHADCEEVVQETFLTAVDSIERYRGEASLYAWLCGIARWKAARIARRRRLPTVSWAEAGPALDQLVECDRELPSEALERRETIRVVQLALSLCPPDHQEVLLEQYYRGRSVPQIAEQWQRSAKAIESLLGRARQSLKKALRRLQTGLRAGEDVTALGPDSLEKDLES